MTYAIKLFRNLKSKPLLRGMVIYSVTWPCSSLIQQSFDKEAKYSWSRALKFSLYGSLFVAPSLYGWMRFSCLIWPQNTLKYALIKGFVEQVSYGPFAMCSFFFIMTLLDNGTVEDGLKEISNKFVPTWKVAVFVWPFVQTINYTLIPEKNRVPFIGVCSVGWTIFLAFMKYQNEHAIENKNQSAN
ncbi:PXMP2/4 family protein 4-like [Planococcus citri]|uniref:PXMP2/4 family protein 4-like n=1 Tax=Planococcus citri TaxID=170843 RepID=UPI0031F74506